MPLLVYVSGVAGSLLLTLVILAQTAFWQRKEYRLDRAWAAMVRGDESRWPHSIHDLGILLVLVVWVLAPGLALSSVTALGWVGLLALLAYHGNRILRRGVVRPDLTNKALLVLAVSVILMVAIGGVTRIWVAYASLWWTSLALAATYVVPLAVAAVNIPALLRKRMIITRAAKHRVNLKDLLVIGITGSYGKTSTKYFLEQLLVSGGVSAVASHKHRNSEFPVAQDMLAQVSKSTSHYIVEMGAYKKGEVAALARLTQPRVGIITAVSNQHTALFGSVEAIASAKWELFDALPDDGVAIINADDQRLTKLAMAKQRHVHTYSLAGPADVWFESIKYEPTQVSAVLHIQEGSAPVTIPVAGRGMLASVAAAIAGAHAAEMDFTQIVKGVTALQPPEHTMTVSVAPTGAAVIDDSYSASEGGVLAAIEHMQRFDQDKRVVVLPPLIELGRESAAAHRRIAEALKGSGAFVLLYGNAHAAEFEEAVPTNEWEANWRIETDPQRLAKLLLTRADAETVVLLAGRVPEVVRRAVLH
ncbi:hypothetical protein CMO91_04445 [Candidatus Woesearchaeota archaeon]|nr:hypothetical protein [Candidatus Woesearchaeota archaeon]